MRNLNIRWNHRLLNNLGLGGTYRMHYFYKQKMHASRILFEIFTMTFYNENIL